MRRAERLVTVLDQRKARTATAIPTNSTCQTSPFSSPCPSAARKRRRGGGLGSSDVTAQKSFLKNSDFRQRTSTVAPIANSCNKCFMAEPAKSSPLSELRIALPSLPMRLREVGRFVAANDYAATTRSMRDLAAV